jgi:Flp pilus assembly pilin Flp
VKTDLLVDCEQGSSLVEMACLVALTVVVAISSLGWLGNRTDAAFTTACETLTEVRNGSAVCGSTPASPANPIPLGGNGNPPPGT